MYSSQDQYMLSMLYDIIFLESSISFQYVMWLICGLWQCNITLILTLSFQIENKINENRNEKEKEK